MRRRLVNRGAVVAVASTLVGSTLLAFGGAASANPAASAGGSSDGTSSDVAPYERIVHDDMVAPLTLSRALTTAGPISVTSAPLTMAPVCDDGVSGNRVQAVYVRGVSQPDTYDASVEAIREAMVFGDHAVDASVADREMHLRMVHSGAPGCVIEVTHQVVPDAVADNISSITRYLSQQPQYQDPSRKILAFAEVNNYNNCGFAYSWNDDSPGGGNLNNGFAPTQGTVGKYCWDNGISYDFEHPSALALAAVHETFHMLGAVSDRAPHSTHDGHCWDENDLMCYANPPNDGLLQYICGDEPDDPGTFTNDAPENFLLDCNDDDYFDPSRPVDPADFLTTNWNTADSDFLYGNEGDRYVSLPSPQRALDSRELAGRLDASEYSLPIAGLARLGVPADATSVVLNVTAIDPTRQMNLTLWPSGLPKPVASNLNVTQGDVLANQVTVKLGARGSVSMSTSSGETDIVVDVVGYYVKSRPGDGAELTSVTPYRVLSSRDGIGPYTTPWGPGQTRSVPIPGVPDSASAVVLNITTTRSTAPRSHLRVFPDGQPLPTASSLNFVAGVNTPNLVTVGLTDGHVDIYNHAGSVDVIADVVGYYDTVGSIFVPIADQRVLDSRTATKIGSLGRWSAGQTQVLRLAGTGSIPDGATGVVLNVTGVDASRNTNVRLFPAAASVPEISNLNLVGGATPRPNAVTVGLDNGAVGIYNYAGEVDLVIDVVGYFIAR